jgi:hypothetical protein
MYQLINATIRDFFNREINNAQYLIYTLVNLHIGTFFKLLHFQIDKLNITLAKQYLPNDFRETVSNRT